METRNGTCDGCDRTTRVTAGYGTTRTSEETDHVIDLCGPCQGLPELKRDPGQKLPLTANPQLTQEIER